MRTPEEIKKGMECCLPRDEEWCGMCPYSNEGCYTARIDDTIAYIQQLEMLAKPNNQIRWERDVAIKQLEELGVGFGEKIAGKVSKWVSVEEELPKLPDDAKFASVSVIAYPKGWNRSISVEYERVTFANDRRVERWRWCGRIFKDEITHWMPSPKPPKEKE